MRYKSNDQHSVSNPQAVSPFSVENDQARAQEYAPLASRDNRWMLPRFKPKQYGQPCLIRVGPAKNRCFSTAWETEVAS